MAKPKVGVIVLGGTITMMPQPDGGIAPAINGSDLLAAVPGLDAVAGIEVSTPFLIPGSSLSFANMREVSIEVERALAAGADGVVVVQGTDTIDETSFLLDLLHRRDEPVVVTGAMRGAAAAGADGPANLLAAVTVAASGARGLGVMVVLNDEIHAARFVEKTHTSLPSAFGSPGFGPIGHVIEGEARIPLRPKRPAPDLPAAMPDPAPVAIVKIGLGDDARLLSAVPGLGYRGLVIEGMGAGHLPADLVAAAEKVAAQMPVVLATRVGGGPIFRRTYGFPGAEMDLIARGLVPAGLLSSTKARLLLALLLGAGTSRERIHAAYSAFG